MKKLLLLLALTLLAAADWLGAAIPVEMLRCRKSRCSTSTRRRRWR